MPGYISEIDYDGGANDNFVEVVIPSGTDVSGYSIVVYDTDGTVNVTLNFDPSVQTIAGQDVYLFDGTDPDFPDIKNEQALALVDDTGTVIQFIAFKDPITATEGPANGMSATQVGEHSGGQESLVTSDGGGSYQPGSSSTPGSVPCFARGTLIGTSEGWRRVEDLRVGDSVMTLDNGAQQILWKRHARQPLLEAERSQKPVLIKAGALGPNRPFRDLIVSPQHRILLGEERQLEYVFSDPVLAASKALAVCPDVRHMMGRKEIEWFHFAFASHEIVFANGCAAESLLLGAMVLKGMHPLERKDLMRLFKWRQPFGALNGPSARTVIEVQEAKHALRGVRSKLMRAA